MIKRYYFIPYIEDMGVSGELHHLLLYDSASLLIGKSVLHYWGIAIAAAGTIAATHTSHHKMFTNIDGTCLLAGATTSAATNAHVDFHIVHNVALNTFVIRFSWFNHFDIISRYKYFAKVRTLFQIEYGGCCHVATSAMPYSMLE